MFPAPPGMAVMPKRLHAFMGHIGPCICPCICSCLRSNRPTRHHSSLDTVLAKMQFELRRATSWRRRRLSRTGCRRSSRSPTTSSRSGSSRRGRRTRRCPTATSALAAAATAASARISHTCRSRCADRSLAEPRPPCLAAALAYIPCPSTANRKVSSLVASAKTAAFSALSLAVSQAIWSVLLRNFDMELVDPFPEPDYQSMVVGPKNCRIRYRRRKL